jgi:PAS domain S-box-containing protein
MKRGQAGNGARGDARVTGGARPWAAPEWLLGGGELADLIRSRDWSRTPLGPRESWPESLRTAVGMAVATRFPMALLWGRELILLYNDAYRTIAGGKHPAALGRSTRDVWPEVWHINEPIFAAVMERGETIFLEDALFPIDRHGFHEDAYFTLCYSPVRVSGGAIGGTLVTLQETTTQVSERRRAREALRESTALLHAISDASPDVIFAKDREGRMRFANPAALALIGKPLAEVLGKTDAELLEDEEAARQVMENDRRIMERGVSEEIEERVPLPDGSDRVWLSRKSPSRDASGDVVGLLGISRDITDRKRAESEARSLAQFPKENPNPVLRASTDGRVLFFNDAALALLRAFGWHEDAPLPEPLLEQVQRVPRRGTIQGHELTTPDQRVWSFTMSASAGEGHVNVFGLDITDRKRSAEALRGSEARFRSVVENMSEGLMIFDARGDTIFQNRASLRIHGVEVANEGLSRHEELPVAWRGWDAEGMPLSFDRWPISRVLRSESFQDQVLHAERVDSGHSFDASYNGRPIRDEQGRFVYGFITIRDITEQRRAKKEQDRAEEALREANEKLRAADRRKDEFLGMLSHELRNPLAPIRNALYVLDHAEPAGQQASRAKEIANRQVAHLTRLVDDLLDVTRIARGKVEVRRANLDLTALVRRTAEDHRPSMEERQVALALELPPGRIVVHGDETRLAQVLGNLLNNAAKFTPAGGRVTVGLSGDRGKAVIRVRDTGAGIDAQFLDSIFDPFTQAKQTLARSEGGLGLGLALVRGIVALHGGEVAARSDGAGRGAELVVSLPIVASLAEATPAGAPESATSAHRRVLVVDDNRDAAESLAHLVEMFGHDVCVAHDGPSALALARDHAPDVVVCDIGLPGMDGYAVARRLRSERPGGIHLVAVSGYAQPEDVRAALDAGFDDHLAKPADPDALARLLSSPRRRSALRAGRARPREDGAPTRVLVVEDNPADAELVRMALQDAAERPFEVTEASSLSDAIARAQADDAPDAILLDLTLPDATGLDAVRRVAEAAPDVPVVVLTGADGALGPAAIEAGAQDFIGKGAVSAEVLARALRYAIARSQRAVRASRDPE